MEKLLTEFSHYLRQNGINVPTSSLEEALKLLPFMKVKNRFDFEISLSQLFVKHEEEKEKYHLCFREFFYENIAEKIYEIEKREAESLLIKLNSDFVEKQSEKKQKKEQVGKETGNEQQQWKEFIQKNTPSLTNKQLKELHESIKENGSLSFNEKERNLLLSIKPKEVDQYTEELIWNAIEKEMPSFVFDNIRTLQKELNSSRNEVLKFKRKEETLLNKVEKKVHSGMRKMIQTHIDKLQDRQIKQLNKEELEEIREYIRQHSRGLFTRFSKLLRQTYTEKELDIPRIIQNSARTYGVPIELFYVKPKKNKTNIHVILDVSGSVVKSAEILLMFMYLIYQHFPNQVRAFTFVGLLTEVTDELKNENWDEMLEWCLKKAPIDYRGYSDYDRAFGIYETEAVESITKDTIVLIVGDARNNKNDARISTFKEMKEKSKAVYWLNPEPKNKWNQGDSVIGKYQEYANEVFEVINTKDLLNSLEGITKDLSQNE